MNKSYLAGDMDKSKFSEQTGRLKAAFDWLKMPDIVQRSIWGVLLFSGLAFTALFASAADTVPEAQEPKDTGKCFLWKVTSSTSTAYLMGAVNYTKNAKDKPQIDKACLQAFDDSAVVMFDTCPFDNKTYSVESGCNEPVKMSLKPKTIQLVMSSDMKFYLKFSMYPWNIAKEVIFSEFDKINYSPTKGIASFFYRQVRDADKREVAVESNTVKHRRLNRLTPEDQDLLVRKALMDAEDLKVQVDRMLLALEWGDEDYVRYAFFK